MDAGERIIVWVDKMKILIDTSLIIEHFRTKDKDKSFLSYIISKYDFFIFQQLHDNSQFRIQNSKFVNQFNIQN